MCNTNVCKSQQSPNIRKTLMPKVYLIGTNIFKTFVIEFFFVVVFAVPLRLKQNPFFFFVNQDNVIMGHVYITAFLISCVSYNCNAHWESYVVFLSALVILDLFHFKQCVIFFEDIGNTFFVILHASLLKESTGKLMTRQYKKWMLQNHIALFSLVNIMFLLFYIPHVL